jgi:tRNA(fMet)-specific endonuclease VapC
MNGKALIDTNIVIPFLIDEEGIRARLLSEFDEAFISTVVLGELIWGAKNSARVDENLNRIEELTVEMAVLPLDTDTAHEYGTIKHSLRVKRRPIPDNDIWVAASARQYGLELVTKDRHFQAIEKLSVVMW